MLLTRFSRSEGRGKSRILDTPRPIMHLYTTNFGTTTSNVIGDMLQPDVNTQILRTLRTGSVITICLSFEGINPVCHGRHEAVP